jgi:dihydroflavonol-4-reductase
MTTALVFGATGFIGGQIALAALEHGWQVRGFRRRPDAVGLLGEQKVDWVDGNLDQPESLPPAFDGVDLVFHAGAYYPKNGKDVPGQVAHAVRQIRAVILAASKAQITRFIYTSSLTTIGPPGQSDRLADERDQYLPGSIWRSAYYESKYAMESEILRAVTEGFPAVILNPTAVFGPGDLHEALGGVLLAAARGQLIAWLEGAINVVDVRDIAKAHITAVHKGRIGQRYILGGHNLNLRDVIHLAVQAAGKPEPRVKIPLGLIDGLVWIEDHLRGINFSGNHLRAIRHWQGYNCEKAQNELTLTNRAVADTFQDALAWYVQHGYLK